MEDAILIIIGIIFVILLMGSSFILVKFKSKKEYKKDAYRLLKKSNPRPKDIKETINMLNIYIGRLDKDEEATELINRLMDKLAEISE